MRNRVESILRAQGPRLTGEIAAVLMREHGCSYAAARQQVFRRPSSIRSLDDLSFPRNASFLYLKEQYGSAKFWTSLIAVLFESNGSYARALVAVRERGGIIPKSHFGIASGAPQEQLRHLGANDVLTGLLNVGLLEELDVPGVGPCIALTNNPDYLEQPAAQMSARLITETVLLKALETWARNLGLGSYNKFVLRDEQDQQPKVGTFQWDMAAPSYLGGIVGWSTGGGQKSGFVVFDVLLNGAVTESGIQPFIHKCTTLRRLRNIGKCIQFFVANRYTSGALTLAKRNGVIPATPATLFGDEVAEALAELSLTLKSAAQRSIDPEKFALMFSQLGKFQGAVGTMRGALFEFVVADIVRKGFHAQVKMNIVLRDGSKDVAEIDVRGVVENRYVYFVECKGHRPGRMIDDSEIEKWLNRRIPIIRAHALQNTELKGMKLRFEFWSTGRISPEAMAKVEKAERDINASKYSIKLRLANDIEKIAQETSDQPLIRVLQQHFIEHDLSKCLE